MKTSVELEEEKVKLAKKLSDAKSLRELLDKALESYIADLRRKSLHSLLGTDFFDGDLTMMRKKKNGRSR